MREDHAMLERTLADAPPLFMQFYMEDFGAIHANFMTL
jgi:hypothetical protein